MFAALTAWFTRKVDSYYSESKPVVAVIIIYLCLNLIFTPLIESLGDETDSAIIKTCLGLITLSITVASTLILLYYYRFWMVYSYEHEMKAIDTNTNIDQD